MQYTRKQLNKWELLIKNGLGILRSGLILLFFSLDFFLDVTVSCFRETRYTPEQPHSNSYLYGEFQKISYEMSAVESVHHPVK